MSNELNDMVFISANTKNGFISYFEKLIEEYGLKDFYLIKGGPGTGKSTFMKKMARAAIEKNMNVEQIVCSSDTNSLDGVIIKDKALAFVDATAPHNFDPTYPGVVDKILNFGDNWDEDILKDNKKEIIEIILSKNELYRKIYNYLYVIGFIDEDIRNTVSNYFSFEKAENAGISYAKKYIKTLKKDNFTAKTRFLSATTKDGIVNFFDTVNENYKHVIVYENSLSTKDGFMKGVISYLDSKNIKYIKCPCALNGDIIEHILLPHYSVAFITSNKYHNYNYKYEKRIHSQRFLDVDELNARKNYLKYNRRLKDSLLDKVIKLMECASDKHMMLEKIYEKAMDYTNNEKIFDEFEKKI